MDNLAVNWDGTNIAILVAFCVTYFGIAMGKFWYIRLDRAGISLLGGIAMLAITSFSMGQDAALEHAVKAINFPSIIMLFGLMVVSCQLQCGGFYHLVAQKISKFLEKPGLFLLILMVSSGVLSAFLNNDVVCFAFTPVVAGALLRARLNPVPFLIALAISSNIGCAGTLIGNAQDVMVGQIAHLGFGEYSLWALLPVILSMAAAYGIIYAIGHKHFKLEVKEGFQPPPEDTTPFKTWRTAKGLIVIVSLVILFFTPLPRYLVTVVGAGLLLCSHKLDSKKVLGLVDWQLLILFIGLFVVVGAFHDSGIPQAAVAALSGLGVNLQNPYVLSLSTGVLSNLINNSAAVMLLIKVVDMSSHLNGYILALSNTFAGNLFLIGSVANIIVARLAEEYDVKITFGGFAKYGVPVALSSFAILLTWVAIMA